MLIKNNKCGKQSRLMELKISKLNKVNFLPRSFTATVTEVSCKALPNLGAIQIIKALIVLIGLEPNRKQIIAK